MPDTLPPPSDKITAFRKTLPSRRHRKGKSYAPVAAKGVEALNPPPPSGTNKSKASKTKSNTGAV